TTRSVSGTFRSKARRLTSTTSPSSSVGRIEPDGIGFQSATAVRNRPRSRIKTRKPRLLRIHLSMPKPPLLVRELKSCCYRPGLSGLVLAARDVGMHALDDFGHPAIVEPVERVGRPVVGAVPIERRVGHHDGGHALLPVAEVIREIHSRHG